MAGDQIELRVADALDDGGKEWKTGVDDADDGLEASDQSDDRILFCVVINIVVDGDNDASNG